MRDVVVKVRVVRRGRIAVLSRWDMCCGFGGKLKIEESNSRWDGRLRCRQLMAAGALWLEGLRGI